MTRRSTTVAAVVLGVVLVLGAGALVGIQLFTDQMRDGRSANKALAERTVEEQAQHFATAVRQQPVIPSNGQLADLGRPLDVRVVDVSRKDAELDLVVSVTFTWGTGGVGNELIRHCYRLSAAGFGTPTSHADLVPLTSCPSGAP